MKVFRESEIVIELDVFKRGGVWYRRGLDMRGNECWEEMEDWEEVYSDNWIEECVKEVKDER